MLSKVLFLSATLSDLLKRITNIMRETIDTVVASNFQAISHLIKSNLLHQHHTTVFAGL